MGISDQTIFGMILAVDWVGMGEDDMEVMQGWPGHFDISRMTRLGRFDRPNGGMFRDN